MNSLLSTWIWTLREREYIRPPCENSDCSRFKFWVLWSPRTRTSQVGRVGIFYHEEQHLAIALKFHNEASDRIDPHIHASRRRTWAMSFSTTTCGPIGSDTSMDNSKFSTYVPVQRFCTNLRYTFNFLLLWTITLNAWAKIYLLSQLPCCANRTLVKQ